MAGNRKLPSIGVINVRGQAVNILYVGGSTFKLDYDMGEGQEDATLTKAQVDELIKANQLALASEDEYRHICEGIDPTTGETATHYANGREKTVVEKTLGQMRQEDSERVARKAQNAPAAGGADDPFAEDAAGGAGGGDPQGQHEMQRSRPVIQDDPFGSDDAGPSDFESMPDLGHPRRDRSASGEADAWSGRGEDDGDLSLKTPPARRGGIMLGIVLGTVVLCVALFSGAYILTSSLNMNLADIPIIGQYLAPSAPSRRDSDDRSDLPPEERARAGEDQAAQGGSGAETVVRSDFDPEAAVVGYALADSGQKEVAKQFFSAVRLAYEQGNADQLRSMIAYNDVHGQIAAAYGAAEQQRLPGMTDAERDTLVVQYRDMLGQRESLHIANHDVEASMYCGRIREVRVDDSDKLRYYVVMESLAGDHQRICFVLQGDAESGAYALMGITDPEGYVRMIREGEVG